MTTPPGSISLVIDGDVLHVTMAGEVDVLVVQPVVAELDALAPVRATVVDLGHLTFLDSIGISVLIRLQNQSAEPVTLRDTPASVARLLNATGIGSLFNYADSRSSCRSLTAHPTFLLSTV